ncbi:MAG: hypothetical protein C0597_12835 [Marinilabiliales bacterium]|nr:MAG: hypothetical protein C0597_12835 [Marinilabiliales bacterium]
MSLIKKIKAVELLYNNLDKEISRFKQNSSLKCFDNCYHCCLKKNIEVMPIEFLPFAYHLYRTNQAYSFIEKLEQNTNDQVCILFNPFNSAGACESYAYRGLICRLFGFSAMINQKNEKSLITCKLIKTEKRTEYESIQLKINQGMSLPKSSDYYLKLNSIDLTLSHSYTNINEAIKLAIETVLFYFSFRNKKIS